MDQERIEQLERIERLIVALQSNVAAQNAAHLAYLDLLRELDDAGGWRDVGIRTIGQWAAIFLGLDAPTVTRDLRTARALEALPAVREAMESGELTAAKVGALCQAAEPATEARWLDVARYGSCTQLQRVVATYLRHRPDDAPEPDRKELRELRWGPGRAGMVRLSVTLEPEDAAIVRAAIDNIVETGWRDGPSDAALDPASARAADALVDLAETALAHGPTPVEGGDRNGIHLLVDAALLAGEREVGVCTLERFERTSIVPLPTAERLACDCTVRPVITRFGDPIDLGRDHRVVSRRLRRVLKIRDGGCTFPGCTATRYLDAHHIDHWIKGGPTDLANLVLLCRHHHRCHHEGGYRIVRDEAGALAFLDRCGTVIGPPQHRTSADPACLRALRDQQRRELRSPQAKGYEHRWSARSFLDGVLEFAEASHGQPPA